MKRQPLLLLRCSVHAYGVTPMLLFDADIHYRYDTWLLLSPDVEAKIAYRNAESPLTQ